MRRVLLLIVLGLVAAGRPAAAQTVVFGVGGELTGEAFTHVRIPVYADLRNAGGAKLGSYTVRVQWDPGVLDWWGIEEGAFGTPIVNSDSAYAGVLHVGGLSVSGLAGLFDLFALQFDVYGGGGSTAVTLAVTEAVAAATFADLTSQVTVVNGTFCEAVGRWGDLDGDGQANSRDALAILSAIVGLPLDPTFTIALGDVDGDALVNSRDALITLSSAVGIDIPGQRVLVLAPGPACGSTGTTGLALLPDTLDLVPGQLIRPLLTGSASGGPAGTTASWTTGNPEVAVVSADGMVIGRSPGTTTVTAAVGPGITATVPVIVRAKRGVWHVDATRATLAAIQMGTAKYPFSTPQYAFPVAVDGDTVLVAPGVHDYLPYELCYGYGYGYGPPEDGGAAPPPEMCAENGWLSRRILLVGDTLADGTRPVLRGNPDVYYAVTLDRDAAVDIRHLEFRNFDYAVWVDGPARYVRFDNVRVQSPLDVYGGAIASYYYYGGLDSVVLRNSEILLDELSSDWALDVEYARHLIIDGLTLRARYGVYAYGVDSVDIRNSDLQAYYEPLYLYGDWDFGGTASYLAGNRVQSTGDYGLYAGYARTLRSERNVYDLASNSYEAWYVWGVDYPPIPGSRLTSFADSVIRRGGEGATYAYGIEADDLDSILIDSLTVSVPDSGFSFYTGWFYGNTIRVSRSRFLNLGASYPLYLGGRDVRVTDSYFQGCRTACGLPYGPYLESYVDSLIHGEVSGNTFYRMYEPVNVGPSADPYRIYVTNNVADSITSTVFKLYGDSIFVSDNVLTRFSGTGIYVAPGSGDPPPWTRLERNRLTVASGNGSYPLSLNAAHVTTSGNHVTGRTYAAYLSNYLSQVLPFSMTGDTLIADSAAGGYTLYVVGQWDGTLSRARILGGNYGAYLQPSTGGLVIDSTVVTGTKTYGIYAIPGTGVPITGRKNNIADNRGTGLYHGGGGNVAFTLGRFVANQGWAVQGTVDASSNWWGSASGPTTTQPNGVSGAVTTTNFLTSDPADVPPLTPPGGVFAASAWGVPFTGTSGSLSAAQPDEPARPDRAVRRAEKEREAQLARDQHLARRQERKARVEAQRPSQQ